MKKIGIFLLIAAAGLSTKGYAQDKFGEHKAECLQYLSYYEEYYKSRAYDDAVPSWRKAYQYCPAESRQTMLINGANLMRRLIMKNARNAEYKKALIDTLMTLHNQRIEFFPKYKVAAYNAKGQDIFNYIKNDNRKLFEEYNAIIEAIGAEIKPTLIVHDFNAAAGLYQAGELGAEELMDVFARGSDLLAKAPAKNAMDSTEIAKAKAELESRFIASNVADCGTLLSFYGPKFDANPADADLAAKIVKMLNIADGCTDNDLFIKALTAVHKDRPSYNTAYYLFRLNAKKGQDNDAIKYMQEAIDYPESDAATDADYNIELAQFCFTNGRNAKAYECALKAAELNPEKAGKAYYLIGNIWGSSHCGSGEVEAVAHYWVAVDYMIKAKNADPSLTEDANRCIGLYSNCYLDTGNAFMYGLTDGQSYTVTCGSMKATTTVRTKKN